MPARKRTREGAFKIQQPTCSPLLLLPQEIKLMIYEYCYLPSSNVNERVKLTKKRSSRKRERQFFENTKCGLPFHHQSLLLTCRETYAGAWPFYAVGHSFGLTRPVKFANEVLSFLPPARLAMIKHLSLFVGDGFTSHNISSAFAVREMVSDFKRTFDHYPDVFYNLLSFTWEVCDRQLWSPCRDQYEQIFYDALLQKLADHSRYPHHQTGSMNIPTSVGNAVSPGGNSVSKKWRTGIMARSHLIKKDVTGWTQREFNSMLFFELMTPAHPAWTDETKGLQYIKAADWLTGTSSRQPVIPSPPSTRPLNSKIQKWNTNYFGLPPRSDMLEHVIVIDVKA